MLMVFRVMRALSKTHFPLSKSSILNQEDWLMSNLLRRGKQTIGNLAGKKNTTADHEKES